MSDRKNIDRLFQEKFKDFEMNPPEGTWANIEARLDEKKKRRVIPFWWRLSGVAAIFLIGFLISKSIYQKDIKPQDSVVNQTNSNSTKQDGSENINNGTKVNKTIKVDNPIVNDNKQQQIKGDNNKDAGKKELENSIQKNSSDVVAATSNEGKDNINPQRKHKLKKTVSPTKSVVAERKTSNQRSLKNKTNTGKNKAIVTEPIFEKSKNQLAQNVKNTNKTSDGKQVVQTNDNKIKTSYDEKNINLDGLKGESNSKIIAQETVKKESDTAAKNSVVSNALEELLNEKESKTKQESKLNRWQLTSNVAPVFLGSVSNGSPIDSTLSKNSKSYNTNVGFGIGVSYAFNKKLSVRTGLNKVNISYNTNDIVFFTGIQSKTLENVAPAASGAMIHVEASNASTSAASPETGLMPFENSFTHKNSGYLKQEIGYLEMPVEMTYNLIDKKFGIKIIGGFSTLFLQDNNISIVSPDRDTTLGKANNLNDVHFSTNLGLGIKYGFMKSFDFNVEPTVKYQLNTFSENAGNFKPYIFGIYSGISYKF